MSRGHVLIVEDDAGVRELLETWLTIEEVQVTTATNGADAWRLLECADPPPNLIFTDLMMPVADGWCFCARLSRDPMLARIPVALISAVTRPAPPLAIQPVAVLTKPINLDDLSSVVREFCSSPDHSDRE
jgi:CheY-like chemotaxis protein